MGFGSIAEIPGGWPGYNTTWPTNAASIAKILQANGYNTAALAKRAFMHLPGVTDEWIKSIEVEKIAGGQVSPNEDIRLIAALIQKDSGDSCCRRKMFDQPDQDAPNLADPDAPCLEKSTVAVQK